MERRVTDKPPKTHKVNVLVNFSGSARSLCAEGLSVKIEKESLFPPKQYDMEEFQEAAFMEALQPKESKHVLVNKISLVKSSNPTDYPMNVYFCKDSYGKSSVFYMNNCVNARNPRDRCMISVFPHSNYCPNKPRKLASMKDAEKSDLEVLELYGPDFTLESLEGCVVASDIFTHGQGKKYKLVGVNSPISIELKRVTDKRFSVLPFKITDTEMIKIDEETFEFGRKLVIQRFKRSSKCLTDSVYVVARIPSDLQIKPECDFVNAQVELELECVFV